MFGKKAKKQQEAQQAENARIAAELRNNAAPAGIPVQPVAPPMQRPVYIPPIMPEQKVFYESEVINDDEEDVVEIELLLDAEALKAHATKQQLEQHQEPDVQNIVVEPIEVQFEDEKNSYAEEKSGYEEEKSNDKDEAFKQNEPQAPTSNIINITNTVVNPYAQQPEEKKEEKKEEQPAEPEVRYIYDGPVEDDEVVKPAKLVKLPNLVDYMLSLNISKRMKMNVATLLLGAYAKFKDIPAEKEILIGCMKKIMYALLNEK